MQGVRLPSERIASALCHQGQSHRPLLHHHRPYAGCERDPFQNPFTPGDSAYNKCQGRTVYRAYKRKTDWVELLGFVLPKNRADTGELAYAALSDIPAVAESFDAGEQLDADSLLVRTD